jgi:hypothetical protein
MKSLPADLQGTQVSQARKLGWLIALLLVVWMGAAKAAPETTHAWQRIAYPSVPVSGLDRGLSVSVDSGSRDSVPALRVSIHWGTSRGHPEERPPGDIADAGKIEARLHLSDGTIVSPLPGGFGRWMGVGGGLGTDWSLMYRFPWSGNKLEEGWIEVRLPQQTFWVELPYGFTRKPSDPMVADGDRGYPAFPPAMKELPAKDVLVPWLYVEYDFGQIQKDWRLRARVSNPFTARAEAILYRENGQWDLHQPRTAMETQWPGGRDGGSCVGIRRTDVFSRTDDYLLGHGPGGEKGRLWGKLVVKVDDSSYECAIPSSLFRYVHGVTDPYHKQRLPRPKPPDGDF